MISHPLARLKSALFGASANCSPSWTRCSLVSALAENWPQVEPRRLQSSATLFVALLFSSNGAHAQGTLTALGIGGSWQPLKQSARGIRLVEQEIHVELPSRRVEVRSVFHNDGAATTIRMGFPLNNETGEAASQPSTFSRSILDKKPLRTRRVELDGDEFHADYAVFWEARVPFARGQTRVMHDFYTSGPHCEMMNAPEGGYRQMFRFDAGGGAKWSGKISRLRAVFDTSGLRNFSELKFAPSARKNGAIFSYEARNFEPQSEIAASWWPGVRGFAVDGQTAFDACVVVGKTMKNGEFAAVYPHLVKGKLWVPLRLLQQWLPEAGDGTMALIRMPPRRTFFNLKWGARELIAAPTSDTLDMLREELPQGDLKMSAPAFFERGLLMVELAPAVVALGGEVVVNRGVTQLWMRKSPP